MRRLDAKSIDWFRISARGGIEILRDLVRTRFPAEALTDSNPAISAFIKSEGYFASEPISPDDLYDLMVFSTLLRASPKQAPLVRLFAVIVQGLVIETMRRGHVCADLRRALSEREVAVFQLLNGEELPEGL